MSTPVQNFFLTCLRDLCHGTQTQIDQADPNLNWERFLKLATDQGLAGLIHYQCGKYFPDIKVKQAFQKQYLDQIFLSVNREDLLRDVCALFAEKNIDFVCMKGAVFRELYPVPELRSMGDLDLVIRTKDREASDRIMTDVLGFEKKVDNHAVWTYLYGPLAIEIHDHMFYEDLANQFDYRGYFDRVWDHAENASAFGVSNPHLFVPKAEFHFLYMMTHAAKHILNKGLGFRAFLDMALFCQQKSEQVDWNRVSRELEKIGLLDFTRTCFALCEEWFDVTMPLTDRQLDPDFLEATTQKMFADGTFGLENEENVGAAEAKVYTRSDQPQLLTAAGYILHQLFPPYRDMQLIPWYSFVDGRPWLLPAAWVYRWYYCLTHKRADSIAKLTEPITEREQIAKRQGYIHDWGLNH